MSHDREKYWQQQCKRMCKACAAYFAWLEDDTGTVPEAPYPGDECECKKKDNSPGA